MPKKIDNRLARNVAHTHPADEQYSNAELLNHLIKYHGWTMGMVKKRGWIENGGYIQSFHRGVHKGSPGGPQTSYQPEEW